MVGTSHFIGLNCGIGTDHNRRITPHPVHVCVLLFCVDTDTLLLAEYLPMYGTIMCTTLQIYTHVHLKIVLISDYCHHKSTYIGPTYIYETFAATPLLL